MLALGNDFAIALDGNTLADVAQQLNQSTHRQHFGELARFAINLDF